MFLSKSLRIKLEGFVSVIVVLIFVAAIVPGKAHSTKVADEKTVKKTKGKSSKKSTKSVDSKKSTKDKKPKEQKPKEKTAKDVIDEMIDENIEKSGMAEVVMKLLDAQEEKRAPQRKMTIYYLSPGDKEANTLIEIQAPKNLRGTKILTLKSKEQTGQWVYLPDVGKVNRITESGDGGSVLDSDLTYADLRGEDDKIHNYSFQKEKWLEVAKESCGEDAYSILARSKDELPGKYKKRILSINKARSIVCRVDFLGLKDKPLKRIENFGFEKENGKWRPKRILVSTLDDGGKSVTSTELVFIKREFGIKVDPGRFSPRSIEP